MTREEAAFNRIFKPRRPKKPTPPTPSEPSDQPLPWPRRTMRVTGPGIDAHCLWEQKYGVWFCVRADRSIAWMATPYCYTEARLPSLKRAGLSYAWLP